MFGTSPTLTNQGPQRDIAEVRIVGDEVVTEESALSVSAVYKCLETWSVIVGSLPLEVLVKNENGDWVNDRDTPERQQHYLTSLFDVSPNSFQTINDFLEMMTYFYKFYGNAVALKIWQNPDKKDKVIGFQLLHPGKCKIYWDETTSQMVCDYQTAKGQTKTYLQNEYWHIRGMGSDAQGLSPFTYASKTIGVQQALKNSDERLASSGFKQSGVLTVDMDMTDEDKIQMRQKLGMAVDGTSDRMLILDYGMKLQPNVMTPDQAQLDKFKEMSDVEICRFFNVPPALAFAENKLGSDMIDLLHAFYRTALSPFLSKVETSIKKNLVEAKDRQKYLIRFNTEEFLKLAPLDQAQMDAKLTELGAMTQNELRVRNTPFPRLNDPEADKVRQQAQMVSPGGSNIDLNKPKTDQKTPNNQ